MQAAGLIVHYAEVATKGKNRPKFIKILADNVDRALQGLPFARTTRVSGRLFVRARAEVPVEAVQERLRTVYGVSSFSPVVHAQLSMDDMKEKAAALIEGRSYETFRVTARRVFKDLPFGSMQVAADVGEYLLERHPAKVKLKGAELEVYIEMLPDGAYLYVDKHAGLLGLPVGMTGKVACLLSGGIDSPVAAARMQRRGCRLVCVHFHSHPFTSRASAEKAVELATHLARYQMKITLHLVPFGELQREIVTKVPAALRVVLYRRFMLRLAGRVGAAAGAKALCTGESLGQVASQTLSNLVAIDAAAPMPVLRPLIAYDKQEIIEEAKKLGTFTTSIQPDEDCCQLFMPRNPETHARLGEVEEAETKLDSEALCADALSRAEERDLYAPWAHKSAPPASDEAPPSVATTEEPQ